MTSRLMRTFITASFGKLLPPARFQRATFRLGVSPRTFTCVISVYHKPLYQSIFIGLILHLHLSRSHLIYLVVSTNSCASVCAVCKSTILDHESKHYESENRFYSHAEAAWKGAKGRWHRPQQTRKSQRAKYRLQLPICKVQNARIAPGELQDRTVKSSWFARGD